MASSLLRFLKSGREKFLDRHSDAGDWFAKMFSAGTCAGWRVCADLTRRYSRGLVLDAGAGRGGWRETILQNASKYESLDVGSRGDHHPDWIGDLMCMPDVPAGRFDAVVCHQVLEHVRNPFNALSEIHRVLKPDGAVILSVPHLSRRHELPNDYFRYTQEGVFQLLTETGFRVAELRAYGGVLSFLHHQTSFIFPGLFMGLPGVGETACVLNAPLSVLLAAADRIMDRRALIPLGIAAVGTKVL
jgi:SAM-dependent methyltransferase